MLFPKRITSTGTDTRTEKEGQGCRQADAPQEQEGQGCWQEDQFWSLEVTACF